ncbi:unnamed protein product, partial [Brachionus calyciflorus]
KKEKYLQDENNKSSKKRCRLQNGYYHLVEEALYKWVLLAKSASIILPYYVLKEKAMNVYQRLKSENIQMRDGFEAESADRSQIEPFKEKFTAICEKYKPDDIYNCDETRLYFRLGPYKTVTLKNENYMGPQEYVDVDESCPVAYVPDDDEIVREVLVENKLKAVINNVDEEGEEEDEPEQEYGKFFF